MSIWTTPKSIRAQIHSLWERGKLLPSIAGGDLSFPMRLVFKGPNSRELSEHFDAVRAWITELKGESKTKTRPGYRLTMRQVNHHIIGNNAIPAEVWIDTIDDALAMIGRRSDAERFKAMHEQTRQRLSALLPWLAKRPLRALAMEHAWERFLDVTEWLQIHPLPGIYIRQVDLPGIDTKFIEQYKSVLSEFFDLALPESAIDPTALGQTGFARRYGFREKPRLIRFRILDQRRMLLDTGIDNDISVTSDTFARLDFAVTQVFITENEINFLAFPPFPDGMVIFGGGYGFEALGAAQWLKNKTIHYWGDIDTHGFAILDSLRARFEHVRSFLMDRQTLLAHRSHWIDEPQPALRNLQRLNDDERVLFDDLCHNRLGEHIRLEQERVGFTWIKTALDRLQLTDSSNDDQDLTSIKS